MNLTSELDHLLPLLLRRRGPGKASHSLPTLALALLLAAIAGGGCLGYRLGPSNGLPAGEKSVQLMPFLNNTLEPGLTDALGLALRQQLQRDGTYRLATHNDGDMIVTGTITRYDRRAISYTHGDVFTVQDYHLSIRAMVNVRDRVTGKSVFPHDQQVTGFTLMRVGQDITSSERQAIPLLAGDLARNITALLADGTW